MSAKFPLPLPYLRTKEAARFIGVSRRTLEKHRSHGTGPTYSKIGGRIIYAVKDLREWAELGAKRLASAPGKTTILAVRPVDEVDWIAPVPDGTMDVELDDAGQPAILGTPAASRLLGVACRTLEKHRIYGTGPKYSKISGRVFYTIRDLKEWADCGARRSTSDPGQTTVLGATPANRRTTKLESGVR